MSSEARPEVVLDVEQRAGAFVLVLANTGTSTAFCPQVEFDRTLVGLQGSVVSDLPVWRDLPMLRPGHQIEILLDLLLAGRGEEQNSFTATVTYLDGEERAYSRTYTHDLALHLSIPTLLM